ncbi:MAG: outer membrane beta-barrel family protein, partial [Taibaiella sp.]|nr:outer membrane beta-barrel family protein [Taibaiella sp.]
RISSDTGLVFSTRGNSDMKQRYMTGGVKLGADYYVSKNAIVGAMVHTNLLDADVRTSNTNQLWTSNISNILHTHTAFNMGRFFISNNLNYKQTLAGIGTLSADVDYIYYHSSFSQTINTKFYDNNLNEINNPLSIKSNSPVVSKITAGKIDLVHPGKRGCKTEAGLKFSYVTSDNSVLYKRLQNNEWVGDNRSNNFIYSENINAGYITQSAIQDKWELQAGVRIEHTHGEGKQVNGNNQFTRDFVDIFPSGLISYKPSEINSFGLTYGRRIERPKYESLNPFLIFLDTLSAEQGNPSLLPQYSNNVALMNVENQSGRTLNEFFILPGTLQLLVENVIKHNDPGQGSPVNIIVKAGNDDNLTVQNVVREKKYKYPSLGIGLQNLSAIYRISWDKEIIVSYTSNVHTVIVPLIQVASQ